MGIFWGSGKLCCKAVVSRKATLSSAFSSFRVPLSFKSDHAKKPAAAPISAPKPTLASIRKQMQSSRITAATPMGLKAMKELQELNPKKATATNPKNMFLVMNTSGLILIPVSIMMYRSQMGAAQPTDIFIPTLITTAISTIVGVTAVSIAQRINLLNKPILILIGCISLFFSGLIYLFTQVSREEMDVYSTLVAYIILFTFILLFILWGFWNKIIE